MDQISEKDILRTVKNIEVRTRRMVSDVMAGEYHSAFRGRGIEFDMVREYQEGDEERLIDWNVTARMGSPYVKSYIEERELTILFVVDISASGEFGTQSRLKKHLIAEFCGVLAFNAMKNNDRVGLLLFSDQVELFVPPKKGKKHILRIIREILYFQPEHKGTSIKEALEYTNRIVKRKGILFLVSDFRDDNFMKSMMVTSGRHDLVAVDVQDPGEMKIPSMGIIEFKDQETGEIRLVDTGSKKWRKAYIQEQQTILNQREDSLKKNGIDRLALSTERSFELDLIRFFQKRGRR